MEGGFFAKAVSLIAAVFISIILHEMGHIIVLIITGIGVHAVYTPFGVMLYENNRFRLITNRHYRSVFVVPDVKQINDSNDYDSYKKYYGYSLIAGPIMTFVLFLAALMMIQMPVKGLMPDLCARMIAVINMFLLIGFLRDNEKAIGDVRAFIKIKQNDLFFYSYLLEFYIAAAKNDKNSFLFRKACVLIENGDIYDGMYGQDILYSYLLMVNSGIWSDEKYEHHLQMIEDMIKDSAPDEMLKDKICEAHKIMTGEPENYSFQKYSEKYPMPYENIVGYIRVYNNTICRIGKGVDNYENA